MTFQFGQDLEMDQLRTNHNISKILTTPFGKKEGCEVVTTDSNDKKGGHKFIIPAKSIRSHGFSLNLTKLNLTKEV